MKARIMAYCSLAVLSAIAACSSAAAQCKHPNANGVWDMKQDNGILVKLSLNQNGNDVTGGASYQGRGKVQRGTVKGTFQYRPGGGFVSPMTAFNVEIKWDYGETGVYNGAVHDQVNGYGQPNGKKYLRGNTYIKEDPGNLKRQTTWTIDPIRCD